MDVVCLGFILLFGVLVSVNAVIKSCGLEIALRGKTITSKMAWEHTGVRDELACAVACMGDDSCQTFSYFPSKKKCLGYPRSLESYMDNVVDAQDEGSVVVRTCRTEGKTVGESCSKDDECGPRGSVCWYETCLCEPGLYFSAQHNDCQKECAEYGNQMDMYKGLGITEHNDKNLKKYAIESCIESCTKEKSFTCLTVDHNLEDGRCHLSRSGYLDVFGTDRERGVTGWVFAQRRCK